MEAYRAGDYDRALDLALDAFARAEETFGPDHSNTLNSVNNLAVLYLSTGRYEEAEPLFRRALEARERVLGPEHPDTLASVNGLAGLYGFTGRYGEAEPLFRRALEARERVLGPEHPDTLLSVNNLAGLYDSTGRYREAEPLYRRALEASERVLGPEHPDTLGSVNNLARLYERTGRYGEAEPLYRRALEARERVLGPEHPDTLTSVNNLAGLYGRTGRYGEAEPLYRRALEARERVLGPEHPDTLTSVTVLAGLYLATGRYGEAEPLYRRALEASERVLGSEHPQTLTTMGNLAVLYKNTGRYGEAEPLFRRALEAAERVLGPEHPQTLGSVNNLALLYDSTGRYGEAEPLYRRALEAAERVLGPEHPDTLLSVSNLAALYQSTGRYGEAEPLYRRALEASERALGPEHPQTLLIMGNLSVLSMRMDQPTAALRGLRGLDQRLGQWLSQEITTTRAAALRRQALRLGSRYQDSSFSLALQTRSPAARRFAADLVLKWKKRLAQDAAVLNNIAHESGDPDLAAAIEAVKSGRRALSNVAFSEDVPAAEKTALREALEVAEADLRARSDKYRRSQRVSSATAAEVALALPAGAALIEYRSFDPYDFEKAEFGATRLLAVILRGDADPALVDLGEADIWPAMQALTVDAKLRQDQNRSFQSLMRLGHDRLIAPLAPHLDGIETLFLSPDGPLAALPFEAFLDAPGLRLIERYKVHTLQTGRDLVARDRPATGQGLVAFGGIDFGAAEGSAAPFEGLYHASVRSALNATKEQIAEFRTLPQTNVEVDYIADVYSSVRTSEPVPIIFKGDGATESALKTLKSPPRVLHLATHGFYLENGSVEGRPLLQSGVTFTGANLALKGETGADGENGILHAVEAQTLNLEGTELVVLSACNTGQGVHDYSEGLEGLPRAFYVAGAQNVLVALWPIGDEAAKRFMQHFYENWIYGEMESPVDALRATKIWYLQRSDPAASDPQNWAPFVLIEG